MKTKPPAIHGGYGIAGDTPQSHRGAHLPRSIIVTMGLLALTFWAGYLSGLAAGTTRGENNEREAALTRQAKP